MIEPGFESCLIIDVSQFTMWFDVMLGDGSIISTSESKITFLHEVADEATKGANSRL